ncbi:MAG: hypothetical protein L0Z50_22310 [Verrucomicrobiales bacterium]|nr:hypothetical protein [Verrucomicrobiales bacterium]
MRRISSFPFFRSVKARMEVRYIFNFRIRPADLVRKLAAPWLEPQVVNGWSAVSFCILWLKRLTVVPFPPVIPFETISCAYRIGVIDRSGAKPEPSVYVTERWADLALAAKLAPWILLDSVPIVKATLADGSGVTRTAFEYYDRTPLFEAAVRPANAFSSQIFASVTDFATFIKGGVSSYAPSLYAGAFTKVDLQKEDVGYSPLNADVKYSELHRLWDDVEMPLDSTVRATGAAYKWTYRGLLSA